MREVIPGPGLRALVGVLGAVASVAGAAVGATELRTAFGSRLHWPALAAAAVCAAVVASGAALVRGAWRGRLGVRSTALRGAARGRR